MYAVIETCGKQYKVAEGDVVFFEILNSEAGDTVKFDNVVLVSDGKKIEVGAPYVKGVSVEGTVVANGKAKKVLVGFADAKKRLPGIENIVVTGTPTKVKKRDLSDEEKEYLMFNGAKTLVQVSSWDAYNSGSDDEGSYKQYDIHGRVGNGFSASSDYLEGFSRNNPTKIYDDNFAEVEILRLIDTMPSYIHHTVRHRCTYEDTYCCNDEQCAK